MLLVFASQLLRHLTAQFGFSITTRCFERSIVLRFNGINDDIITRVDMAFAFDLNARRVGRMLVVVDHRIDEIEVCVAEPFVQVTAEIAPSAAVAPVVELLNLLIASRQLVLILAVRHLFG